MKAIILAAGRGSRMGSETDAHPKGFVRLGGRRLMDWQLDALRDFRAEDIAIVRGYLAEKFDYAGVRYFDNPRWSETNMVCTLMSAADWLQRDACIVSYSDIVYSKDVIDLLREAAGDIVLTYDPHWEKLWTARSEDPLKDAETFEERNGILTEIGNRAATIDEIKGQYMGLLKFTPAGWAQVESHLSGLRPEEVDKLDMTGLLRRLLAAGTVIRTVPIRTRWLEVDTISDLRLYEEWIRQDPGFLNTPWK